MKKDDIKIAQLTLDLLKKKLWNEIKFEEIIQSKKKQNKS